MPRRRNLIAVVILVVAIGLGAETTYLLKKRHEKELADRALAGGPAPLTGSPLEHPIQLRNASDYTAAKEAAAKLATGPFQKVDRGEPLNRDEINALYQAARLYDAMAAFVPTQPAPDFTCGQCLEVLGFHKDAIQKYRQFVIYIGPRPDRDDVRVMGADAHGLMSQSYFKLGDFKSAQQEASSALEIYPNTVAYLTDRAQAEIQLGDTRAAKTDIDQALATDPNNSLAIGLKKLVNP